MRKLYPEGLYPTPLTLPPSDEKSPFHTNDTNGPPPPAPCLDHPHGMLVFYGLAFFVGKLLRGAGRWRERKGDGQF